VTATITPEEARRIGARTSRGALVTRVFEDSPAARAGLREGDIITKVEGNGIDSRESFNTQTATARPGERVRLSISRDGTEREITLTVIEPPAEAGLQILEAASGIVAREGANGVVIYDIRIGSRAEATGLAPGDPIVGVNGVELRSLDQLDDEILKGSDRSSIVLQIARGRFIYSLSFPLGQ
jgi:S1-C subfamily serine protease